MLYILLGFAGLTLAALIFCFYCIGYAAASRHHRLS